MTTSYKQKTVMITGAAGAVGRVVAQHFAQQGARLVLVDRSKEALQSLMEEHRVPKARYCWQCPILASPMNRQVFARLNALQTIDCSRYCGSQYGDQSTPRRWMSYADEYINAQVTFFHLCVLRALCRKSVKARLWHSCKSRHRCARRRGLPPAIRCGGSSRVGRGTARD